MRKDKMVGICKAWRKQNDDKTKVAGGRRSSKARRIVVKKYLMGARQFAEGWE